MDTTERPIAHWTARHGLAPHPEGGFYRELHRADAQVTLPDGRVRATSTHILYALEAGAFSALHRVRSEETWHRYAGGIVRLTVIAPDATVTVHELGGADGPCAVVPADHWQAAEAVVGDVLCGCTVAPGFDFADFEMPPRAALVALFPGLRDLVERLTRS